MSGFQLFQTEPFVSISVRVNQSLGSPLTYIKKSVVLSSLQNLNLNEPLFFV